MDKDKKVVVKPTYDELVEIVKELNETNSTAYDENGGSVGYCVFVVRHLVVRLLA